MSCLSVAIIMQHKAVTCLAGLWMHAERRLQQMVHFLGHLHVQPRVGVRHDDPSGRGLELPPQLGVVLVALRLCILRRENQPQHVVCHTCSIS